MPVPSRASCGYAADTPHDRELGQNAISKYDQLRSEIHQKHQYAVSRPTSAFSSTKDSKMSQNLVLKSRYCQGELGKPEYGKKVSSCSSEMSQKRSGSTTKKREGSCDATFLRKLLAMNKKEEMLLNKKLVELLGEQEFGKGDAGKKRNKYAEEFNSSFSYCRNKSEDSAVNEKRLFYENLPPESVTTKTRYQSLQRIPCGPSQQIQFDLNGRRVYHTSDVEDDEAMTFDHDKSKTWINTTTVIKTKSNISCDSRGRSKITSRRKSMTVINQPLHLRKNGNRYREEFNEEDELSSHSNFTETDTHANNFSSRGTSQGGSSPNVVVHCCEVSQDNIGQRLKKKILRVWNFNDIPKFKPGANTAEDDHSTDTTANDGIKNLLECKENSRAKSTKDMKNCSLRSCNTQPHRRSEARSKTLC